MNAVEIEEAVSELAAAPFDAAEFPWAFLRAFGNKETTIKGLRSGSTNKSDVPGGVLQRNNVHMAICGPGQVSATLAALRGSPKTATAKAKFILSTDGETIEAEDLTADEPPLVCEYRDLPRHFGFLLPLAGISTVRQIKDNPIDVRATGRLNKLYVQLLQDNPDWDTEAKRPELNRFMARLIFCFFAEDTGIFNGQGLFSSTVEQMSDAQSGNTHEVLAEVFRAMTVQTQHDGKPDGRFRAAAKIRPYADAFPYVNGGLFSDAGEVPRFTRIARRHLLRAAELTWRDINPDIFGSMIQAVADDAERGELGMHYTSVPNILKVLDPLFLDNLRTQLEAAGDSVRKLRALRRRMAAIRVFDPACGSGNFLVIAYLKMREIEAKIVRRTGDEGRSVLRLTNFYGIEIKSFAAEIARLALLIAEFQADVRYIGQEEARSLVLPLHDTGRIVVGNALRLDWLKVCPAATWATAEEWDLGGPTGRLALENSGLNGAEPETYLCGNPPYSGSVKQSSEQKADLAALFDKRSKVWKSLDYVAGWLILAADYIRSARAAAAFVATKSISQGEQVPLLWPEIYRRKCDISFAHLSFQWSNLASNRAAVTVVVIGLRHPSDLGTRVLFSDEEQGLGTQRHVSGITPYLTPGNRVIVKPMSRAVDQRGHMVRGNMANDGGHLVLSPSEAGTLIQEEPASRSLVRPLIGSAEFINGTRRYCLWIENSELPLATAIPAIRRRIEAVRRVRTELGGSQAQANRGTPHRFVFTPHKSGSAIVIPRVSSVNREYLPVGMVDGLEIISDRAIVIYGGKLLDLALLASRLHLTWIGTVCVRMRMDFSYSNTLGWNTFPIPRLTEQNKTDLTRCAEDILLAREAHFPATIADLYDPEVMPDDLRRAHERNDETLERIYIGRRFRNDTERLEKLFDMYAKMTAGEAQAPKSAKEEGAGPGHRRRVAAGPEAVSSES